MIFRKLGRAVLLALSLFISSTCVTHAHSLPGSILTFSHNADQLKLSLNIALNDLITAAPALRILLNKPAGEMLSKEDLASLSTYFKAHLQLTHKSQNLQLTLSKASLQTAENDHVGQFVLLTSELNASFPESESIFPLTLDYDAVMHEIRSHRASVYWAPKNTDPIAIANFGFRRINGKPQTYLLQDKQEQ